jgi:hypothetical protein
MRNFCVLLFACATSFSDTLGAQTPMVLGLKIICHAVNRASENTPFTEIHLKKSNHEQASQDDRWLLVGPLGTLRELCGKVTKTEQTKLSFASPVNQAVQITDENKWSFLRLKAKGIQCEALLAQGQYDFFPFMLYPRVFFPTFPESEIHFLLARKNPDFPSQKSPRPSPSELRFSNPEFNKHLALAQNLDTPSASLLSQISDLKGIPAALSEDLLSQLAVELVTKDDLISFLALEFLLNRCTCTLALPSLTRAFTKLAKTNPHCAFQLGKMALSAFNYKLAKQAFLKAQNLGHPYAETQLARISLQKTTESLAPETRKTYLKILADDGCANSQLAYSQYLQENQQSQSEAIRYLQMAADLGNKEAQKQYAHLLHTHFPEKQPEAIHYLKKWFQQTSLTQLCQQDPETSYWILLLTGKSPHESNLGDKERTLLLQNAVQINDLKKKQISLIQLAKLHAKNGETSLAQNFLNQAKDSGCTIDNDLQDLINTLKPPRLPTPTIDAGELATEVIVLAFDNPFEFIKLHKKKMKAKNLSPLSAASLCFIQKQAIKRHASFQESKFFHSIKDQLWMFVIYCCFRDTMTNFNHGAYLMDNTDPFFPIVDVCFAACFVFATRSFIQFNSHRYWAISLVTVFDRLLFCQGALTFQADSETFPKTFQGAPAATPIEGMLYFFSHPQAISSIQIQPQAAINWLYKFRYSWATAPEWAWVGATACWVAGQIATGFEMWHFIKIYVYTHKEIHAQAAKLKMRLIKDTTKIRSQMSTLFHQTRCVLKTP